MITHLKRAVGHRIIKLCKAVISRQQTHICDVRGHIIQLDVESEIEVFRAATYTTKEPETFEWIERYFRPGDVMYDIGANVGLYSLFAAKNLSGQCKIFAFEPEALNYAKLSKNIHLNCLSGVVLPCCLALTDRLSFDKFYLNPRNFKNMVNGQKLVAGSAWHSFGTAEECSGVPFQPIHMQGTVGVSLDHLWQVWSLDFPNHLKIDVDGLEDKIIAGATRTLQDKRLRSALIEILDKKGNTDPILHRLTEAGFKRAPEFDHGVNSVFIRG